MNFINQGELLDHLRDMLTPEEFMSLVEEFGGQRTYVPIQIRPSHRIARTMGQAAADKMAQAFGGVSVRIPLAREIRVRYHHSKGMSAPAIARRMVMTESGVKSVLRRANGIG